MVKIGVSESGEQASRYGGVEVTDNRAQPSRSIGMKVPSLYESARLKDLEDESDVREFSRQMGHDTATVLLPCHSVDLIEGVNIHTLIHPYSRRVGSYDLWHLDLKFHVLWGSQSSQGHLRL